jgi:GT2 family glycosyltransferase
MDPKFEEMMNQVNDMLQLIADKMDKPLKEPLSPDLEAQIGAIERQVAAFRKASRAEIANMGISDEDMEALLSKESPREAANLKKIQERTEHLKSVIESKKEFLEGLEKKTSFAAPQDRSISEEKRDENKASPHARKNLFSRVGGKKNWRPL